MIFPIILVALILFLYFYVRPFCQKRLAPRPKFDGKKGDENLDFGKDFMFGGSTAAWQVEKDVHPSNWTLFEKKEKADGTPCCPPHNNACEAMERFDDDMKLMKELNFKMYRFGVSWSALNPKEGEFDKQYMQKYVSMCKKLKAAGIEPFVTIWHFENPDWVELEGGILSPNFEKHLLAFTEFVVSELKDVCTWFFTVNEPVVFTNAAYATGNFPPGEKDLFKFLDACGVLMQCHAKMYKIIHKEIPNAKASIAKHVIPFYPMHEWSLIDSAFAYINNNFNTAVMDGLTTGRITYSAFGYKLYDKEIEGLKDSWDFVGINHYYCSWASFDPRDWDSRKFLNPPFSQNLKKLKSSDFGWSLVPESLAISVKYIHENWNKKNLPIVVSEHGIADAADKNREWFTIDSLAYLKELKDEGLPIIGYSHWSFLDNYEWADGFTKRFGLVEVNFETQERKIRESAKVFAKIAAKTI